MGVLMVIVVSVVVVVVVVTVSVVVLVVVAAFVFVNFFLLATFWFLVSDGLSAHPKFSGGGVAHKRICTKRLYISVYD